MTTNSDRGRGAASSAAKGIVDKAMPGPAKLPGRVKPTEETVDTRALLRLAEKHVREGDHAVACEVYVRAGDAFVGQGFARRAISAFLQAMDCAKAQVSTHGRLAPISAALAKLYAKERLVRDALATLDGAAKFLVERGADAHAVKVLEERIGLGDTEIARVRLAEALVRLGEVERAADELAGVFTRLRGSGQRDDAIEVAERLLHHRRDVAIARQCAEMYLTRNRPSDPFHALTKLRICCERDATHAPTLELLARAFDLARHPDKAARVRREIASLVTPAAPAAKKTDDSMASTARAVEAGWDDLMVEAEKRIDVGRPSFWAVSDVAAATEDSVAEVSLADVELVDSAPRSEERATLLETTLESVDALVAQARFEEAAELVVRQLALRPTNPLLLDRKSEIEEMKRAHLQGPPPALFGARRRDSERSIPTGARAAAL